MSVMIRGLTVQLEAGSGRDSTSGIAGPHFKRRASATTLPCLTSLRETHLREGSSFRMIKLRERKLFPSIRNQDPFMATYRQVSIGKKNSLPRRLQLRSVVVLCAAIPWLLLSMMTSGCRTKYREDLDYSYNVQQTWQLEDLNHGEIVQFESVFWEPDDTISLRKLIVDGEIASGRDVLEIGTGTGILSILCLQSDAKSVVATDINEAAVANAKYNSAMLVPDRDLDVRQVSKQAPQAFAEISESERFDLILSNPPWEDGLVGQPADHAFYDPGFALMTSLLDGLPQHLKPGGRCLLAYGHAPAVQAVANRV